MEKKGLEVKEKLSLDYALFYAYFQAIAAIIENDKEKFKRSVKACKLILKPYKEIGDKEDTVEEFEEINKVIKEINLGLTLKKQGKL